MYRSLPVAKKADHFNGANWGLVNGIKSMLSRCILIRGGLWFHCKPRPFAPLTVAVTSIPPYVKNPGGTPKEFKNRGTRGQPSMVLVKAQAIANL